MDVRTDELLSEQKKDNSCTIVSVTWLDDEHSRVRVRPADNVQRRIAPVLQEVAIVVFIPSHPNPGTSTSVSWTHQPFEGAEVE